MNSFLEDKGIKPIVADRTFDFHAAREAYQYMDQQEFFGKIVIKVDHRSDEAVSAYSAIEDFNTVSVFADISLSRTDSLS
jgi:hypothetical protein